MNKAAIYVSISNENQMNSSSIDIQINKCKEYCSLKNIEIYKVYQDVGNNKTSLDEIIKDTENKLFNFVITASISRISRNNEIATVFFEKLHNNNNYIISIDEDIDTSTAFGKIRFMFLTIKYENKNEN